jgi:hypothetical protein
MNMNRMVVKSRISSDGILHLALSVGLEEAGKEVQITVDAVPPAPMSQEDWRQFIMRTAGSIADPAFRRHEQGEFENREALSSASRQSGNADRAKRPVDRSNRPVQWVDPRNA